MELGETKTLSVEAGAGRLDRWLAASCPELSRARWQEAIAAGLVLINGNRARPSEQLKSGDTVTAQAPPPREIPAGAEPENIPLEVLYEDEDLLCLNKPAGLVVHPATGHWTGTLVNAVMHHATNLSEGAHPLRPGIVHRLDKDTSGCILVAKTDAAHAALAAQFAERTARKTYLAVVRGNPRTKAGVVNAAIERHPTHRKKMTVTRRDTGRPAETAWKVLVAQDALTLLECRPKTGRTHQIRVHLKHLGHPVAGDRVYGGGADFPRQLLHAWQIAIRHPRTGEELVFTAPVPPDFPLRPPDTSAPAPLGADTPATGPARTR